MWAVQMQSLSKSHPSPVPKLYISSLHLFHQKDIKLNPPPEAAGLNSSPSYLSVPEFLQCWFWVYSSQSRGGRNDRLITSAFSLEQTRLDWAIPVISSLVHYNDYNTTNKSSRYFSDYNLHYNQYTMMSSGLLSLRFPAFLLVSRRPDLAVWLPAWHWERSECLPPETSTTCNTTHTSVTPLSKT